MLKINVAVRALIAFCFCFISVLGIAGVVGGNGSDMLFFIENKGQLTDQKGRLRKGIDFHLSADGFSAFIGKSGISYQFKSGGTGRDAVIRFHRVDVLLKGANKNAVVIAGDRHIYEERYFTGSNDKKGFVVSAYRKLVYRNIYPEIDWVLYIKGEKLEYDFIVHPGGRVTDIQLEYNGADSLRLNENGSLSVVTGLGRLTENAPVSFTCDNGKVNTRFVLDKNVLRYKVAPYKGTLTIDPQLQWATYYGGNAVVPFAATATDKKGNVFLGGMPYLGANIATAGVFQTTVENPNVGNSFIAKFDSKGRRIWGTYFRYVSLRTIDCDEEGNVYGTGMVSWDEGIATAGSHQQTRGGVDDSFLCKFNANGQLAWCTYYGGGEGTWVRSVCCDKAGNVFIGGSADGSNKISTPGSHQPLFGGGLRLIGDGGKSDAFLVKFNSNGVRQWGTFYGGAAMDVCYGITCDKDGNIYMAGTTASTENIATANGFMNQLAPGLLISSFLAKFNNDGVRQWGTYYAGSKTFYYDQNEASYHYQLDYPFVKCATDAEGNVYLAGNTQLTENIATPGADQLTAAGNDDLFLTRFSGTGGRIWSTYYGGAGTDWIADVKCDADDAVYLIGKTNSNSGITTAGSYQPAIAGGYDGFFVKYNKNGKKQWASYYGGPDDDWLHSMAMDSTGYFYLAGYSLSRTGIATDNGFQPGNWYVDEPNYRNIAGNVFLAKFAICDPVTPSIALQNGSYLQSGNYSTYQWYRNGEPVEGANSAILSLQQSGIYTLSVTNSEKCRGVSSPYTYERPLSNLFIPNLFSPNGDNKNDVFKVYGNRLKSIELRIFNQWGQKVYESRDMNAGWDGRMNGVPQPVGVYAYTLQVVPEDGETVQKRGTVSLIR